MDIERARESLKAAQLCLQEELVNSATSRAYYAIFQAAQVAIAVAGSPRDEWSHSGLQAAFVRELIHRRKYTQPYSEIIFPLDFVCGMLPTMGGKG
ncbi:MAG: HEPN domain-containing protein [Candidatus Binatia bacterium]